VKTIRFDGPEGDILRVGDRDLSRGDTTKVPDDVAEELVTAPYVAVSLVEDSRPAEPQRPAESTQRGGMSSGRTT